MLLSLPRHVPMRRLLPFVGVVMAVQMLEGTNPVTAFEYGAFLLISASAFNALGGMIYPSGAYVTFFAMLSVGLGGMAKVVLGEPLDSNVADARKSMLVYVAFACSMWLAAQMASRLRRKQPWLIKFQLGRKAPQIALGSALVGQLGGIFVPAAFLSTFNQLNNFFPFSILIFSYGRTKETNGRSSFSAPGFLVWAFVTIGWGLLAFSKQGMFTPSAIWAIGALLAGYRTTPKKLAVIVGCAVAGLVFLTPVSQVGRNYQGANRTDLAFQLITHPLDTREQYLAAQSASIRTGSSYHWFDQAEGLMDRLTMFPIDSALIHRTDEGHSRGIFPIVTYLTNTIPRYLLPGEKPNYHWGNRYAHEIGLLGKRDLSTGISFSPVADGYHCALWWGVTAVSFPILLAMFLFCDSLTGSTEQTLWAGMYILIFSHQAPEGMLNAPFAATTTFAVGVVAMAFLARWVLPYIGGMLIPVRRDPLMSAPLDFAGWAKASPAATRPSMARTIEDSL